MEDQDNSDPDSCLSCRATSIAVPYAITIYTLYAYRHPKLVQNVRDAGILLTIAGGFFLLGSYAIFIRNM